MFPTSLLTQDDITDQGISDDQSDGPGESSLLSDIVEDNLDHQEEILLLGQARHDLLFRTTMVQLPKKFSHADTVIPHPPLPNSRDPAGAMPLPLLKRQKSTLLNKLSEFDCTLSTHALLLRMTSGDQNIPQPNANADQNVPQHQKVTFQAVKTFMEAIVVTKTPWPRLSNDKY